MKIDLTTYILKYHSNLMSPDEIRLLTIFSARKKAIETAGVGDYEILFEKILPNKGKLIEIEGLDENDFRERIANRILREHPEIYINRCPVCETIARTPVAKQASCGHRWK